MGQASPFVKPQTKFEKFPILWYALPTSFETFI